jgi:hypothetical protein
MSYHATVSRSTLYMLLFALFISVTFVMKIRFPISLAVIIATLLRFHISFDSNRIEYKITILKYTIFRKILTSENIKKIKFGRIGWTTKNAVIKMKQGINIGVAHFYSEQLIRELEEFALTNDIEVKKTRDYLLLEKYYTHT